MTLLAVSVLGPDQPGVVAALTEVLLAEHGNLEDVSMTLLRGQFAMTLVVSTPVSMEQARADLAPVAQRLSMLVTVRTVHSAAGQHVEPFGGAPVQACTVRLHGADRPGLVHRVTATIARFGGNITDLTTRLVGSDLYVLIASVDIAAAEVEPLRRDLGTVASELQVDVSVELADDDLL